MESTLICGAIPGRGEAWSVVYLTWWALPLSLDPPSLLCFPAVHKVSSIPPPAPSTQPLRLRRGCPWTETSGTLSPDKLLLLHTVGIWDQVSVRSRVMETLPSVSPVGRGRPAGILRSRRRQLCRCSVLLIKKGHSPVSLSVTVSPDPTP